MIVNVCVIDINLGRMETGTKNVERFESLLDYHCFWMQQDNFKNWKGRSNKSTEQIKSSNLAV